jgi:hypothetical protein
MNAILSPEEVRVLLSRLCIRLGFCLPPLEAEQIAFLPPCDIDEFTRAVFIAEGMDPVVSDRDIYNQVSDIVAESFVAAGS